VTTAISTTRLAAQQLAEAGAMLGRAFFDDPMMAYIMPDDAKRPKPLTWFMTASARYAQRYGEVYTTEGQPEGAACWLPPGEHKVSPLRMVQVGLLAAPFRMGITSFRRFLTVVNHVEHLHDRDMAERHWYLMVLGVDPPRQGRGVGGTLIQPILARADAEHLPCYLETMKPRNVPFYERHGFQVLVEDDIPKGGPHFWTMKRPPR
jgi:GNAT superfamily N-acetyltransferase